MTKNKTRDRRQFLLGAFGTAMIAPVGLSGGSTILQGPLSYLDGATAPHAVTPTSEEGGIEFESPDKKLSDGFRWAKAQALAYARTDGSIGPWYEASLPGRNAFCMRDVSHMSTGAQFLGLGPRTMNMLRRFAANIS